MKLENQQELKDALSKLAAPRDIPLDEQVEWCERQITMLEHRLSQAEETIEELRAFLVV